MTDLADAVRGDERTAPRWETDFATAADLDTFDRVDPYGQVDDDDLTAQAMAEAPADTPDDDAVSYWDVVEPVRSGLLPDWYMPTPSAGARRLTGWRRRVVFLVIFAIGVINAAGLCVTYGRVTLG